MGNVILSGIVPPLEKPVGGTLLSTLAVGSTLKLNVNGVAKDFLVVHQGKPSSIYDDSCDGVWLLMKDLYESRVWDSTNNDYENSDIHSYLNSTFLGLFDADIQSTIKQVKIPYRAGSGLGTTVTSGASGLSSKVFLLSGIEVNWSNNSDRPIPNDGASLSYFSGCVDTDSKRAANLNGSPFDWWFRTPYCMMYSGVKQVLAISGTYLTWNGGTCTDLKGIRPCIILPSDALLSEDGTIIV